LNVARYFCKLGWRNPIDTRIIEKKIKESSIRWSTRHGKFQTARVAINNNKHLKMRILREAIHVPHNPRIQLDIMIELTTYPTEHKYPLCALLMHSNTYTYLFMYRCSGDYIIFDSHGSKARLCYFSTYRSCEEFLKKSLNFTMNRGFEVIWIQPILKKRKKNLSVSKSEKNKKQKK
jgi:hypothetical protein